MIAASSHHLLNQLLPRFHCLAGHVAYQREVAGMQNKWKSCTNDDGSSTSYSLHML